MSFTPYAAVIPAKQSADPESKAACGGGHNISKPGSVVF